MSVISGLVVATRCGQPLDFQLQSILVSDRGRFRGGADRAKFRGGADRAIAPYKNDFFETWQNKTLRDFSGQNFPTNP